MTYFVSFVIGAGLALGLDNLPRLTLVIVVASLMGLISVRKPYAACWLMAGIAFAIVRAPAPAPIIWDNPVSVIGYFHEPAGHYDTINHQGFVPLSSDYPNDELPAEFDVLSKFEFIAGVPYSIPLHVMTPRVKKNPAAWKPRPYARVFRNVKYPTVVDGIKPNLPMMIAGVRHELAREIDTLFATEQAALIKAVTVGHRVDMPPSLRRAFQRSGLAHLLSISGTHFGFFAVALFFLFKWLVGTLPHRALLNLTMHISPAQIAAILTLPPMILYLGLSGGNPPSVRAFVMTSLFLFGLLVSAQGNWMKYLAVAAFLLTLWDPAVVGSLSFLLSFSAVLFIGLALNPKSDALDLPEKEDTKTQKLIKIFLIRPVQLTLAASFGVLPIVIYTFHELSTVSPLANILVAPLVCILLVPLCIIGAAWHMTLGVFITAPIVELLADYTIRLAAWLSSYEWSSHGVPPVPGAFVFVYYASILPWLITRRIKLMPLMAIPLILYGVYFYAAVQQGVSVTLLDTGAADSAVIEMPGRKTAVIDTARHGSEVAAYLRHQGIRKINPLFLTHNHYDHTGGAARLAGDFEITRVLDNGLIKRIPALENLPQRTVYAGEIIDLTHATVEVLHPAKGYKTKARGTIRTNDNSLVLKITAKGGGSMLMTGDVQGDAIEALEALEPQAIESDVVKLPHHGKMVTDSMWIIRLSGASVIAQTGPPIYGYSGIQVINTWEQGAIKIMLTPNPVRIKTYADYMAVKHPDSVEAELQNLLGYFKVV